MAVSASFVLPHPPLILPEVGKGEERKIQKTVDACREAARRLAELRPQTIVLVSPHAVMYQDYFHISPGGGAGGDLSRFGAPSASVKAVYDAEFVQTLSRTARQNGLSAGTMGERDRSLDHGTIIPLRFINQAWKDYRLVRIGLSGLSAPEHYRLGKCVGQAAAALDRRVVIVASGDLSHRLKREGPYGFAPEGP